MNVKIDPLISNSNNKDILYAHKTVMNIGNNILCKSRSSDETPKSKYMNHNNKFMIIESSRELLEQESSFSKSSEEKYSNHRRAVGAKDTSFML